MRIRAGLSASLSLAVLLAAGAAHAEGDTNGPSPASVGKPTRRSDFTLGLSAGFGVGRASGYPNEVDKIGSKAYRSNTKLALGNGGLLWLGVAFNDYLTFGIGLGGFGLSGNDRDASASLFGFHVDAYPLFDVHEHLRDLGVFANVGTGPMTIKGGPDQAEGGLMSYLEGGLVYERLRLWQLGLGPSVSVIHMWSDSATVTGALIGARVAFYGGP
jgi:hypothetical protein